jgi:sigma-B regulation protein RsbU (phosphoserine phosphatase)
LTTAAFQRYRDELLSVARGVGDPALHARLAKLASLLEFAAGSEEPRAGESAEAALLRFAVEQLQAEGGAVYVRTGEGDFARRAATGLAGNAPERATLRERHPGAFEPGSGEEALARAGLAVACRVHRAGLTLAVIGLGPRADGRPYSAEDLALLECLSAMAATPIEATLASEELRRVNRDLSVRVYQLQNLFDLGRELAALLDEDAIERLVVTTVMGHFLATRAALYHATPEGLELGQARGARLGTLPQQIRADLEALASELPGPRPAAALAPGLLREALAGAELAILVPMLTTQGRLAGLLAIGPRPGAPPVASEDLDFAAALARHTQAALEGARLHRLRLEKQRQDRDLEIARGIQLGLLPREAPCLPGFELTGESRSCHQVGGDYFDFVPLAGERLGLVIADVSGKGTPASLMMASVHAWLRALAGSAPAELVLERLNRFVYSSTEMSRYVTLFYGELDPLRRRLTYVNAGHVPPFLVRASGGDERLRSGGPVLGLLEEVRLEPAEVELAPGDLLAAVTDGVTEAVNPGGQEFGDERVRQALLARPRAGAQDTLDELIASVDRWAGAAGCSDDLTALILRAT